jgi:hypothetical protein
MPPHTLVRPLSMSSLIVWLCGVKGMFVFFLKMQNTRCRLPSWFIKPYGPSGPKDEETEMEDFPWDREPLRLIPPPTRGQPRKWLLARQTQNTEPSTWGQIKRLMDMAMMVTGNLGMAGNPTATLPAVLITITIHLGACTGRCILDFHAQTTNGWSYHH